MKQTSLDLNGPILSFVTQPTELTVCSGVAATFTGIATATFPTQSPVNQATNTGIVTYRWYDQNGPLFDNPPTEGGDGVTISGAGTTTLTLYNNTQSRSVFVRADYIPSAYQTSSPVTAGTARSTGNAINEPTDSNTVNLTLYPLISITSEPLDATVAQNAQATFSTTAAATDGSAVSYQWQLNGQNLTDTTTQTTSTTPTKVTITVTDDLGELTIIDFSKLSTYSNFIKGRTYTLVSSADITTRVTAAGAGGGTSGTRQVSGGAGGLSTGTFTFLAGQTYQLIVGGAGEGGNVANPNPLLGAGGFGGGGNGGGRSGLGGGGGGYTGLFGTSITQTNAIIIAGGGGGGNDDPANGGGGGGASGGNSSNVPGAGGPSVSRGGFGGTQTSGGAAGGADGGPGTAGSALQGGRGGAGGGGGYFGGGGGQFYTGCCAGGAGGGGSGYIHPTLLTDASTTQGAGSAPTFDGTFKIDIISAQVTAVTTVSGSQTPNLRISTNVIGLNQVRCIVSHPTACNSPVSTRSANFVVVLARAIMNFEGYSSGTNISNNFSINFETFGSYTHTNSTAGYPVLGFYAPEKDVDLELEIYAAKGNDNGGFRGGQGGISIIRFTARQNEEYIVAPLPQANQGGAVYIYRKARLIAAVGSGGDAGSNRNGGDGGGINVSGADGSGREAGRGGSVISAGNLPQTGIFGSLAGQIPTFSGDTRASAPDGGRVLPCARGGYWREQGKQPCEDLGNIQAYWDNGTLFTNSAVISRGHKIGYGIRQTGGAGISGGGNGGQGATGGSGGVNGAGGGGGSGYTDGSVRIMSTRQGGNDGIAKVVFKLPRDQPVTWTVTRGSPIRTTNGGLLMDGWILVFTRTNGSGPDTLTFGPKNKTFDASIGSGSVYTFRSLSYVQGPEFYNQAVYPDIENLTPTTILVYDYATNRAFRPQGGAGGTFGEQQLLGGNTTLERLLAQYNSGGGQATTLAVRNPSNPAQLKLSTFGISSVYVIEANQGRFINNHTYQFP